MDLHHYDQRQAPGRDFHGMPGGRIQIDEELIVVERTEVGPELPATLVLTAKRMTAVLDTLSIRGMCHCFAPFILREAQD